MDSEKGIVYLDLFAGIGGFHKGIEDAGIKIRECYFSEINEYAIANYKYNFPKAKHIGSVKKIQGKKLERPDLMTYGFPCQDLSIAGKRKGLKGKRSGLFYEAVRIARESNTKVMVFENVKGLLSSNENKDFEAVCEHLYLSGFIFDFSVLNTVWYLPQNRERVFCVAYNINYLWELSKDQDGINQKKDFFVRILEGFLEHRFQKHLTEALKELPIRQYEWGLEQGKEKFLSEINGTKEKSEYLSIISGLDLAHLKIFCRGIRFLLLKQKDTNYGWFVKESSSLLCMDITSNPSTEMVKKHLCSYIEKLWKMISEENLHLLKLYTILIWSKKITTSTIYSYVEIEQNINLFMAHLINLCPNLLKEATLNLIEKQKNILYVEARRNKIRTEKELCSSQFPLPQLDLFGNDSIGLIGEKSGQEILPVGESDEETDGLQGQSGNVCTITTRLEADANGSYIVEREFISQKGEEEKGLKQIGNIYDNKHDSVAGRVYDSDGIAVTLKGEGGGGGAKTGLYAVALTEERTDEAKEIRKKSMKEGKDFSPRRGKKIKLRDDEIANTITSTQGVEQQIMIVEKEDKVIDSIRDKDGNLKRIRRLTPTECCRLQGFPDDWCKYGIFGGKKKLISDSQQYKMLGNAVSTPVSKAVASQIIF